MKSRAVKMYLLLAFLMVSVLRIEKSCQNIDSDEDHDQNKFEQAEEGSHFGIKPV